MAAWVVAAAALVSASGCAREAPDERGSAAAGGPDRSVVSFVADVEEAHGAEAFRSSQAVAFDIAIRFGEEEALRGHFLYDHVHDRARLELPDGTIAVFDGERAWVAPARESLPMARFHLRTWPYFLCFPFKLGDPGARIEPLGRERLGERVLAVARLDFEAGTGDTPRDWYRIYADPDSSRVEAVAYVVTYGTRLEEAEAEPHALVYGDYRDAGGALLATRYDFHLWSEADGLGERIGGGEVADLRLVDVAEESFQPPPGAEEDPPPGG
jgi:hypothetical protein